MILILLCVSQGSNSGPSALVLRLGSMLLYLLSRLISPVTQFSFFYSPLGLSLCFLPGPFLSISLPHRSGTQGTLHFPPRVITLFVKPSLNDFSTLWLVIIATVLGNGVCVPVFLMANGCHMFNSAMKSMIKACSDLGLYHMLQGYAGREKSFQKKPKRSS